MSFHLLSAALTSAGTGAVFAGVAIAFISIGGSREWVLRSYAACAVGNWLAFLGHVLTGELLFAVTTGCLAALMTWLWWRNRRGGRRRKALKELGAKSRARVEALVRQMTPSPIPTPVGGGSR